jgi:tRNA nucleotidyltransferase (CCA-adding enzyme)
MGHPLEAERRAESAKVEAIVSARVAPTPEFLDRVARVRSELVTKVEAAAHGRNSPLVRALVAGSAARGTFLSDRLDIDLFLLFPPDLPRGRLREEGLALGRSVLEDPETRYAEHPYLRGKYAGFQVDAVPGYAITDPSHPLSPVDRTPFHQEYLSARETPELVSDVRLAKQFFRALGVYGSEARTEGFSGYLVELLVLRFGSFGGLLSAARSWRVPTKLAEPGHEPPRLPEDVALILADPVDANRNVASALSRRNLATFILGAGVYLDHPSERWFEVRPREGLPLAAALRLVAERSTHVTVVELPRPDLVDDTLYPQVRKAEHAVADEMARAGFEVLGSASAVDPTRVVLVVELGHGERPSAKPQDGPPAGIDRVGQFLEKWTAPGAPVLQGPYVRADGSLGVDVRRTERGAEEVLRSSFSRLSLGRDLTPKEPGQARIVPLEGSTDSPALEESLRALVAKRLPWQESAGSST